jgi:hypothetical protein
MRSVKTAAGEYENAIVGGRIAKPVEYQDARGFILEAERMLTFPCASIPKPVDAAWMVSLTRATGTPLCTSSQTISLDVSEMMPFSCM